MQYPFIWHELKVSLEPIMYYQYFLVFMYFLSGFVWWGLLWSSPLLDEEQGWDRNHQRWRPEAWGWIHCFQSYSRYIITYRHSVYSTLDIGRGFWNGLLIFARLYYFWVAVHICTVDTKFCVRDGRRIVWYYEYCFYKFINLWILLGDLFNPCKTARHKAC